MSQSERLAISLAQRQEQARKAFMAHLRAMPRYQNFIRQDLRPLWATVIKEQAVISSWIPLSIIDESQRGPQQARRMQAAREASPRVAAHLAKSEPAAIAAQARLRSCRVRPCAVLEAYLDAAEHTITHGFRLTDHGRVPWFVLQEVHADVIGFEPADGERLVDWWRIHDIDALATQTTRHIR